MPWLKPIFVALGSLSTVFALTLATQSQPSVAAAVPASDASPVPAPAPAPDALTLFQNVRVFDGASAALSPACHVLVRGQVVVKISQDPIPPGVLEAP